MPTPMSIVGEIAIRSGVDLTTVIERIRAMLEAGAIRRVRQTLMSTNLASGALVAWQVRLDTYLARSVAFRQQPPGTTPVSERNRAAAVMCDRIRAMGMPCAVYQH